MEIIKGNVLSLTSKKGLTFYYDPTEYDKYVSKNPGKVPLFGKPENYDLKRDNIEVTQQYRMRVKGAVKDFFEEKKYAPEVAEQLANQYCKNQGWPTNSNAPIAQRMAGVALQ